MDRNYYDLTFAQRILYYSQKYTLHKQVNNVATFALTDQKLDVDILTQAIRIAVQRNDCFNIRFEKVKGDEKQYFAEYEEPVIEYLDFEGKTREVMDKKLYKIAKKRVTKNKKPMYKIHTICSPEGTHGIYFVVSHMILDSWGITTFFKDIFAIYSSLINGTEMPKPLYPYEKLLIEELNYRNTPAYEKDKAYFQSLFVEENEPIFTHINGSEVLEKYRGKKGNPSLRYASSFNLWSKADNHMLPIDKELVDEMNAYCTDNKISMQSLILLVYTRYVAKVNFVNDISMHTVVARRGTLREKNTGGTRVHFFPFRTVFEREVTVQDACKSIDQQQSTLYRYANMDPLEVVKISKETYNVPQEATHFFSSLTFQPVKLSVAGMNLDTKWYGNGAYSGGLYLTVMDGGFMGGLKIYYEYQVNIVSLETIQKFHSYMIKALEKCVREKDATVGDLLDIDEQKMAYE
ncbi:condensation domain-containing protein [Alkalibaculum bacchi]|uniref:Condensation domain-containing protein n=1 Tax=Alkalibaculum bacchi TaxID=645887 RepID=A0A366IBG6_9FIRM|nr:condensation domain-containing protein [Alkalibaculum bacchi]RBP66008.1 condensation domain-containing protein [Alkalibaculum bacchi]